MSRVDELLNQLKDVASNPKKAMDDYKNETGKGAIRSMPEKEEVLELSLIHI